MNLEVIEGYYYIVCCSMEEFNAIYLGDRSALLEEVRASVWQAQVLKVEPEESLWHAWIRLQETVLPVESSIIHRLTHGEPRGWPVAEFMEQAWAEDEADYCEEWVRESLVN